MTVPEQPEQSWPSQDVISPAAADAPTDCACAADTEARESLLLLSVPLNRTRESTDKQVRNSSEKKLQVADQVCKKKKKNRTS